MYIKFYFFKKEYHKFESIQGGKMEHIFEYSFINGTNMYNPEMFTSKEAEEAFYKGKWTIKFHGSNGFITKDNKQLKLWERHNLNNKDKSTLKEEYLELNDINNNLNYKKAILPEKNYIYIKIDEDSHKGKILYPRVEKLLDKISTFYQSIEYVGKKIQGNEEYYNWNLVNNKDYGIVFHSSIEICILNITYLKLIEIARLVNIEGWVIYHNNKAWKIRTNMIVPKSECAFNINTETLIKPHVY